MICEQGCPINQASTLLIDKNTDRELEILCT